MSQSARPIFITARFRSGSTLLWNMFRRLPGYRAFYEPCHPNLLAHIQYTKPMASHRGVSSYWDEYVPLRQELEQLHQPQFGFQQLVMESGDEYPDLERYIRFLIESARPDRPVLKFNRVDFRLPWLRARFPDALVIHLWRSPRESWVSTRRHLPREKWDDPDHHDAFELFQWCAALGEAFPFLTSAEVQSSYQSHYCLWRLSRLMGDRCSDCSISYDDELRGEAHRGIQRLVEIGAIPFELAGAAATPLEPTEPLDWRDAHPESWFEQIEQRCEGVLANLGLIDEFGMRPLHEIRRAHESAWSRCAAAPRKPMIDRLLAMDARHRSENTRLLHEARRLQGLKRTPEIVIDARCVGDQLSGIERYVLGLLEGLTHLELHTPIRVLTRSPARLDRLIGRSANLEVIKCNVEPWSLQSQARMPRLLHRLGCRVYHCPDLYGPLVGNGFARAITIHDVIPHLYRKQMRRSWKSRLFPIWNRWFRAHCKRADRIITVSDSSKRELLKLVRLRDDRVQRIYNGVDVHRQSIPAIDIHQRFNISGRIVSYVGRHDPYKNLAVLVQAFAQVAQTSSDVTLVIGGKIDLRYPDAQERTRALGLSDRVVFTDYLNEAERIALLRASSVFVFPSRHEGFGLPPLEAMAEGVPVVAANAASLPEVLGDAALLVDPDDVRAMGEAISSVLRDDALANSLRTRGRQQAERFTWQSCAQAHLKLYEELARQRRSV